MMMQPMQQQPQMMMQPMQQQPQMMMQQQPQLMQQQPQMMMQPMMMHPSQMMMQQQQQPSATGAHAAELIKNQLNSEAVGSVSMLDVAPEVKPAAESSSSSSEGSEGKRVIKLS
jgi:hypothetical protein